MIIVIIVIIVTTIAIIVIIEMIVMIVIAVSGERARPGGVGQSRLMLSWVHCCRYRMENDLLMAYRFPFSVLLRLYYFCGDD